MPRKRTHERANGPYPHGRRFRVVTVGLDGARRRRSFETELEALDYLAAYRAATDTRSVGQAVTEYLDHVRVRGNGGQGLKPASVITLRHRLIAMLRLTSDDRELVFLDAATAAKLYARRTTETRPDTHRGELAAVQKWAAWCVKQGWIESNPFASVEPVGAKSRGKPQLRIDEARRYLNAALADGTPAALAASLPLLLGLRASEVVERVARDLDDGGRLLWIPSSKTRAGIREIEVPEVIRARLVALATGKGPTDRIFGDLTRYALHYHVERLCGVAGVPVVPPHGLRGLHATIGVRSGVSVEHVAAALGHAGTAVTRNHYLASGAEASAGADRLARLLVAPTPQ